MRLSMLSVEAGLAAGAELGPGTGRDCAAAPRRCTRDSSDDSRAVRSLAAVGAVLVGLLESYSSFWASAYKEAIVFTLIIPVLLWRSLTTHHVEEEEE